jgi:AraC-like DNA-binding protein/ligand-binding sensor protein
MIYMSDNTDLIDALANSRLYRDYERAFSDATGLPVALSPVESWQLPHHARRCENRFCALLAAHSHSCAACLQAHQKLMESAAHGPRSVLCPSGFSDTAVPVRTDGQLVGFLQTGQVFRSPPTAARFEKAARLASGWGIPSSRSALREAWFSTRVLTSEQHDAIVTLLDIFARHLSLITSQITIQRLNSEPPAITRAKQYLHDHHAEDLSLQQVARAVNTSSFYFCKLFRRVTGLNYTDYLARLRIDQAKNLLMNPNLRVCEIAYEVGFQSLTHFNRVFKRIVGRSPTAYRDQLLLN